ncbi:uncharacterized protein LOC102062947 [Zonotrichia albicollis]|uniref:uncharacterized protein LOC102062947 n=1 Tax=Zonotrichia albicollis TaxID=44394 RepID=UPI003D80D403
MSQTHPSKHGRQQARQGTAARRQSVPKPSPAPGPRGRGAPASPAPPGPLGGDAGGGGSRRCAASVWSQTLGVRGSCSRGGGAGAGGAMLRERGRCGAGGGGPFPGWTWPKAQGKKKKKGKKKKGGTVGRKIPAPALPTGARGSGAGCSPRGKRGAVPSLLPALRAGGAAGAEGTAPRSRRLRPCARPARVERLPVRAAGPAALPLLLPPLLPPPPLPSRSVQPARRPAPPRRRRSRPGPSAGRARRRDGGARSGTRAADTAPSRPAHPPAPRGAHTESPLRERRGSRGCPSLGSE